MAWVKRASLLVLKVFLLLVVTMMVRVQIPELRYDFGRREPVVIESAEQLSVERFSQATFASVQGEPNLARAARYATHAVPFTYFLLDGYGANLVVRSAEPVDETWSDVRRHLGRLRPYHRMPFSRSVRAGFRSLFGVDIPDDALFLARDDVPRANGWSIGAVIFASVLWCVLAYVFFIHPWVRSKHHEAPVERAQVKGAA